MRTNELIAIRAAEEVTEHGDSLAAIHAIERQIASPDSVPAERAFMRKVRNLLLNASNQTFYAQTSQE